jgi:hypothetical protein
MRAMPSARAATPSGLSRFASSCLHRIAIAAYLASRWLAPRLPTTRLRGWAWAIKWRLWHSLYGPHVFLWECEQ